MNQVTRRSGRTSAGRRRGARPPRRPFLTAGVIVAALHVVATILDHLLP